MGGSGACLLARRCPDTPCLALTAAQASHRRLGVVVWWLLSVGFVGISASFGPVGPLGVLGLARSSRFQLEATRAVIITPELVGIQPSSNPEVSWHMGLGS